MEVVKVARHGEGAAKKGVEAAKGCAGPSSSPKLQMMSPLLSAMQPGSAGHTSDIMEAAGRFVGALGKSIMEGAAPMLDSLIKANMEVITTSRAVKFHSGDKNVHQVEVTFQSIFF